MYQSHQMKAYWRDVSKVLSRKQHKTQIDIFTLIHEMRHGPTTVWVCQRYKIESEKLCDAN